MQNWYLLFQFILLNDIISTHNYFPLEAKVDVTKLLWVHSPIFKATLFRKGKETLVKNIFDKVPIVQQL